MVNTKRIMAALACLSIAGVNAGPCKPRTTTGSTETAVSVTSDSSVSVSTSTLASVTETSTSTVSSETASTTDSQTATSTTGSTTSDELSTASTTTEALSTTETTTTAAATTTSAAPVAQCNNEIYRGTAQGEGYKTTEASTDQECHEACFNEDMCHAWWFSGAGSCKLYTESFSDSCFSHQRARQPGGLPRTARPDDYTPCNDDIGFGYITPRAPSCRPTRLTLERDCAHLCMKNGQCTVWQYDSSSATGSNVMLAGSRSCSSDLFKPQLGNCNGKMSWNAEPWEDSYRTLSQYTTVATCARACSIDPLCQTWLIWVGYSDCYLYAGQFDDVIDSTDIATAGSRNCGVP
ncbi:hypothetical protein NM208_g867 [Fusarium decemcellulare]|uniref:Uncharacterized protein n=1 Tax=Fusarium decemcellulare TaxID=57161 RepID=A0ACC1SXW1_9HYPO|nr:hypothetical protein NM208_g867 [Fusarium decemcellulare]